MRPLGKVKKNQLSSIRYHLYRNRILSLLVFLLAFALYGNTIGNEYGFDDHLVTKGNALEVQGLKGIPEIFSQSYIETEEIQTGYRPMVKLSYALEYAVFKGNPHVSHFLNTLMYAVLCVLLFLMLRAILYPLHIILPFLAIIIFTVHPIHTEVVASLKNRDELLSLLFTTLSIWCFLKFSSVGKKWTLILGIILFYFAVLSKINAVALIAILPLIFFYFAHSNIPRSAMVFGTIGALVAVHFIIVIPALAGYERPFDYYENPIPHLESLNDRLGTATMGLWIYLEKLTLPLHLKFYYGYAEIEPTGLGDIKVILALVVYTAIMILGVLGLIRKHPFSFGAFFFLFHMFILSNYVKYIPGVVVERGAFAASLGFSIMLAWLLIKVTGVDLTSRFQGIKLSLKWAIPLFLFVGFSSFQTIHRNAVWYDTFSLVHHDIQYLQKSAKANQVYAALLRQQYLDQKEMLSIPQQEALLEQIDHHFITAIRIAPEWVEPNRAYALHLAADLQEYEIAIPYFFKALEAKPGNHAITYNLANCYVMLEDLDSATFYYEQTIQLNAEHEDSQIQLNRIREQYRTNADRWSGMDSLKLSIPWYEKMLTVRENDQHALNQLCQIHYALQDTLLALEYAEQQIAGHPRSDTGYINRAAILMDRNEWPAAIADIEQAIEINPERIDLAFFLMNYFAAAEDSVKMEYYKGFVEAPE